MLLLVVAIQANTLLAAPAPPKSPTQAKARRAQPVLPDSLAQRVERAYFVLSRINGTARRATNTEDLSDELPTVEDNLETIRENLDQYGDVVDVKQLQMYRLLLADMQEKLGGWRTTLADGGKQLVAMQARLDTLATQLPPAAQRPPASTPVGRALARLQSKEDKATALLRRSRQTVTGLQTRVSDGYIQVLELQDVVREQMGRFNRSNAKAELPPLWLPDGEWPFLLGTDPQGRDILSVILYGSRVSLMIGVDTAVFHGFVNCGATGAITGIGNVLPREVLHLCALAQAAAKGDVVARRRALELEAALAVLSSFDEGPDLVLYFKHMMVLKGHDEYRRHFNETDALSESQRGYVEAQLRLFETWYASWSRETALPRASAA